MCYRFANKRVSTPLNASSAPTTNTRLFGAEGTCQGPPTSGSARPSSGPNIKSLAASRPPEMFRPVAPRAVNRTSDSTSGRTGDRTGDVANTRYPNLVGFYRTGESKYEICEPCWLHCVFVVVHLQFVMHQVHQVVL